MKQLASNVQYDSVPYESFCYPQSHPQNMYTVAKLFGVDAPDFRKCKVLELGCASGGNIIPLALDYPDAEFVGIDLSEVQIRDAQKHQEALKLKNIRFEQRSIADITKDFGVFDYIIVHGILSWVPEDVQNKIFEICKQNLAENGIAYISYNTLPGWNMVKSVRDMMLYHTANFQTPADKVNQARLLLNFVKEGSGVKKSPYSDFIQNEIDILKNTGDAYLLHDHMEETNTPFYFHQFMEKAGKNDLQYLGDTNIYLMYSGNLPKDTVSVLAQVKNDIVRTEQYMDFITNRRFRSSLLCKKGVKLNRSVEEGVVDQFCVSADVKVVSDGVPNPVAGKDVTFKYKNGIELTTSNPGVIAAVQILEEQKKKPIGFSTLIEQTYERLKKQGVKISKKEEQVIGSAVRRHVLKLILAGSIEIGFVSGRYVTSVSDKPVASQLARYQATCLNWSTNQNYRKIEMSLASRLVIQCLDGKNDFASIVKVLQDAVDSGKLVYQTPDGSRNDKPKSKDIEKIVSNALNYFAANALLTA